MLYRMALNFSGKKFCDMLADSSLLIHDLEVSTPVLKAAVRILCDFYNSPIARS